VITTDSPTESDVFVHRPRQFYYMWRKKMQQH